MFEQLENLLNRRDYSAAARILTQLRTLITPRPKSIPRAFVNAAVRVLPLDQVIRVYIALDCFEEWQSCPGHCQSVVNDGEVSIMEKTIELGPEYDAQYRRCVVLHFMHCTKTPAYSPLERATA